MAQPVQPTGRVVRDRQGLELLLERRLPAGSAVVWGWLTNRSKQRRWLGAALPVVEKVHGLRVVLDDGGRAVVSLAEVAGSTMLFLGERVVDWRHAGLAGPRWEFALDRLGALIADAPAPNEADYTPSQRPYYERLAMDGDPMSWPPS